MSFALNEVEAMAKRATRGAGYPWGLAEEAAKATRWLCAHGLDGVHVLAALLEADTEPDACPVTVGACLSDRAANLGAVPITLDSISHPAMILAFAAQAARQVGTCVTLTCSTARAVTDGHSLTLTGALPTTQDTMTLTIGGALGDIRPLATRARPAPEDWDTLTRFAHRTYAPATEESRLLGAGAGISDND